MIEIDRLQGRLRPRPAEFAGIPAPGKEGAVRSPRAERRHHSGDLGKVGPRLR